MSVSQVDELLNNPGRIDYVINSMANFLADVMLIKDEEQSPNVSWDHSKTFGKTKKEVALLREQYWKRVDRNDFRYCEQFGTLLFQEFEYKADEAQEAYLRNLHQIYEHTIGTMKMCVKMTEEAEADYNQESSSDEDDDDDLNIKLSSSEFRNNVDLCFYAFSNAFSTPYSPYFFKAVYQKPHGGYLFVGAICRDLRDEFERLLLQWLHDCDQVFCDLYNLECNENDELDKFISEIAIGLARKHCAMFDPQDKELKKADVGSQLSYLQCMAEAEFMKNSASAFIQKKHDADLLNDLLILAQDGGKTKAGQEVLLLRTPNVLRVIDSPPQELAVHLDKRRAKFNFEELKSGIADVSLDNPFLSRCERATAWSERHGAWVADQIDEALKLIWRKDYLAGIVYFDVASTKRSPGCVTLAPNPCAYEEENWFAHKPDWRKRSMLTNDGARLVCIATLVWNKLKAGCFKFGTCRKSIISNVSADHMRHAKYMQAMLDADRLISNQGVKLRMFERNFQDLSSDVCAKLNVPVCKLSGISVAEMYTLFSTEKIFNRVRHSLSSATRKLVPNSVVPEQYIKFTDDALSIVLETVFMRRQAAGMSIFLRTNPIADLLRCIPKIQSWKPVSGRLTLGVGDLKHSHPDLRRFLEHHASTSGLAKRVSNGRNSKLEFVFDSLALFDLMKN